MVYTQLASAMTNNSEKNSEMQADAHVTEYGLLFFIFFYRSTHLAVIHLDIFLLFVSFGLDSPVPGLSSRRDAGADQLTNASISQETS